VRIIKPLLAESRKIRAAIADNRRREQHIRKDMMTLMGGNFPVEAESEKLRTSCNRFLWVDHYPGGGEIWVRTTKTCSIPSSTGTNKEGLFRSTTLRLYFCTETALVFRLDLCIWGSCRFRGGSHTIRAAMSQLTKIISGK